VICLKTREEIELIRKSCLLAAKTLAQVGAMIQPGITTLEVSRMAEAFIKKNGGDSAFREYQPFPHALCISVNDTVGFGIPDSYTIQEGDIVTVDCGVVKNGWFGSSCYTFLMQKVSDEKKQVCKTACEALHIAIGNALEGYFTGAIGNRVQNYVGKKGFSVVREITGHGTGREFYEQPEVPNAGKQFQGKKMVSGMVITIKSIVNAGTRKICRQKNGWTGKTCDGKPSACYGQTVAVGPQKADILSTFDEINLEIKKNSYLWQNSLQ